MGKKGSWFSAIKRVFTPSSKEKPSHESEKKSSKEKKGRGKLKRGETKSFIPLFREPSSIEQILGEVDEQQLLVMHPASSEQRRISSTLPVRPTSPRFTLQARPVSPPASSYRVTSPKAALQRITSPRAYPPPRASSPKATSPKVTRNRKEITYAYRPEPTLRNHHLSATKIQAAYRGYMARRSFRALRGLVRLQGVVRSSNVRQQTVNAMKQMQLLVRVQTQIQSRRIQVLENQALQHQAYKGAASTISKWTQLSEAGNHDDWDASLRTKEEAEARLRKKVEAVIKRERAMAYAYSHQLWKGDPKSALNTGTSGFPWWWNWLERQLPSGNAYKTQPAMKDLQLTAPRVISEQKSSPMPLNNVSFRRLLSDYDNHESLTPMSTKSAIPTRGKQMHTPSRTPPVNSSSLKRYSRISRASAANSPFDLPLEDDDSLTSCPPFSAPRFMEPTVSAKAKIRAYSNPKERNSTSCDTKRRFSFPLTPNIWSSKWRKGSGDDSTSRKEVNKHESMPDHISVDSTVSMPAVVGRKPFNRFV